MSAPLLIVVGITTTSSFVIPSLYQQTAILRLVYILVGGGSGLYGIALCTVLLMININSMDDLAVSYTAPVTPFFSKGIKDVISRRSFRSYEKTHSTIKEYKLDERGEANEKAYANAVFAMLICTRAFSMMTFLPESTANALELMLGTVLSTVFR